jgi:hypothetical protein
VVSKPTRGPDWTGAPTPPTLPQVRLTI